MIVLEGKVTSVHPEQAQSGFLKFITRIKTSDGSSIRFTAWKKYQQGQILRVEGILIPHRDGLRFKAMKLERLRSKERQQRNDCDVDVDMQAEKTPSQKRAATQKAVVKRSWFGQWLGSTDRKNVTTGLKTA